ncbi:MAG: hypothetical protein LBI04_04330 [Treponema sp.]|jgi:hypothetical protein|nr:hypothetical protein [Treponema sp.]
MMNIFRLDLEQLDLDEAKKALSAYPIERLPGVPPFLSKKECAAIIGVSMKVINHLTESGQLPLIEIPGDSSSYQDLFGDVVEPSREKCILRADVIDFMEKALLCNKPVLDPELDH